MFYFYLAKEPNNSSWKHQTIDEMAKYNNLLTFFWKKSLWSQNWSRKHS